MTFRQGGETLDLGLRLRRWSGGSCASAAEAREGGQGQEVREVSMHWLTEGRRATRGAGTSTLKLRTGKGRRLHCPL